jgi:hypothetical protein
MGKMANPCEFIKGDGSRCRAQALPWHAALRVPRPGLRSAAGRRPQPRR